MNVYDEAVALVNVLLEAEPAKTLTVKVLWHERIVEVPAVRTKSPRLWTSFITDAVHGMQNFTERVDEDDQPDFIFAFRDLLTKPVLVPAKGHWALKMPGGYALLGEVDEAVTCTKKRQIISWDQQLTENPNMTDLQTRQWGMARKGL